jgi:major pilin subunit PapA
MKIKLRTLALTTLTSAILSGYAFAADTVVDLPPGSQGNGEIMFKGSVIKAPCGLAPGMDGDNQNIDLGQISDAQLMNVGYSAPKAFQIKLIGCDFTPANPAKALQNKVNVRFDGMSTSDTDGYLGVSGDAKGVAINLLDAKNQQIKIGSTSSNYTLHSGDNTLQFSAQLVKLPNIKKEDGKDGNVAIVAGTYNAITNFALTYL